MSWILKGFIKSREKHFLYEKIVSGQGGVALNLQEEIFMLDIGKESLAVEVVRPWHRSPREASCP